MNFPFSEGLPCRRDRGPLWEVRALRLWRGFCHGEAEKNAVLGDSSVVFTWQCWLTRARSLAAQFQPQNFVNFLINSCWNFFSTYSEVPCIGEPEEELEGQDTLSL